MIGEIVGDVVPDVRSLRDFRSFLECGQRFIFLIRVEVGLSESDLKSRIFG